MSFALLGLAGLTEFALTFQASPIILTGGIAGAMPGGMLPILTLAAPSAFPLGLLGASLSIAPNYPINFRPLPGSEFIANDVGEYPLANQQTAGNAIIARSREISFLMDVVASEAFPYPEKLSVMSSLIDTLKQHNQSGGTYTLAMPVYYEINCIMINMLDVSSESNLQPQSAFELRFRRQLITVEETQQVLNNLMGNMSGGSQIQGQPTWSSIPTTTGTPIQLIPGASGIGGAQIAPNIPAPVAPTSIPTTPAAAPEPPFSGL